MNATFRNTKPRIALLALATGLWITDVPSAMAAGTVDSQCRANCIEILEESDFVHTFYVDAKGQRIHMSTSLRAQERAVVEGIAVAAAGEKLRSIPLALTPGDGKSLGCGIDGWGWNHGDTMWTQTISDSASDSGRTRTDARSTYMARGRGVLFVTTTTFPSTGAPTSSTQTSGIEAPVKAGAERCTREN